MYLQLGEEFFVGLVDHSETFVGTSFVHSFVRMVLKCKLTIAALEVFDCSRWWKGEDRIGVHGW